MNKFLILNAIIAFSLSGPAYSKGLEIQTGDLDGKLADYGRTYNQINNLMTTIEKSAPHCPKQVFFTHVGKEVAKEIGKAKKALADHVKDVGGAGNDVKKKIAEVEKKFSAGGTTIGSGGAEAFEAGIVGPVSAAVASAKRVIAEERTGVINTKRQIDQNDANIRGGLNDQNPHCRTALNAYVKAYELYNGLPRKLDGINGALDAQVAIAKTQARALADLNKSVGSVAKR